MELPKAFKLALAERYEIQNELAEGTMGAVFVANDLRHPRRVAIKVLRPDAGLQLSDVRFVREIKFLAQLQHPHILPLYDSGRAVGLMYYVMPYVQGDTLRARIGREMRLPVRDAVRIAEQMAEALDYAHRHGIIHRDVKPENIVIAGNHAMLMDFGIARALGTAGGDQLTDIRAVGPGTPAYMSPEQMIPGQELDGRSDVYSLATVLFEALTGDLPFRDAAGRADMARKVTTAPPSVRALRLEVPATVDRAIARALSPMPADRFTSAQEFGNALGAALVTPASVPAVGRHWWSLGS